MGAHAIYSRKGSRFRGSPSLAYQIVHCPNRHGRTRRRRLFPTWCGPPSGVEYRPSLCHGSRDAQTWWKGHHWPGEEDAARCGRPRRARTYDRGHAFERKRFEISYPTFRTQHHHLLASSSHYLVRLPSKQSEFGWLQRDEARGLREVVEQRVGNARP